MTRDDVIKGHNATWWQSVRRDPGLIAELEVFDATERVQECAGDLLEHARTAVIEPFRREVEPAAVSWPDEGRTTPRGPHAYGLPELQISGLRPGHEVPRLFPATEEGWAKARQQFATGLLAEVTIMAQYDAGELRSDGARVSCDLPGDEYPGAPDLLRLSLSSGPALAAGLVPAVVGWFIEAALRSGAERGHVLLDHGVAHEIVNSLGDFPWELAARRGWVRGYQWGTLLGPSALDRLGGLDRVLAEPPVDEARGLDTVAGERVWLRLTRRIEDVADDHLRALKRYLEPVLTPVPEWRGWPHFIPPVRYIE